MNTKDLLDKYYSTKDAATAKKTRAQIDRPELYKYEIESGKSLEDWDSNDVIQFLILCNSGSKKLSSRSISIMVSILRNFFDWYIDEVKIIKNPCNDRRIRTQIKSIVIENTAQEPFTKGMMEKVAVDLHRKENAEYADYCEAIMRMAYEGFGDTQDIVLLKDSDIDHDTKIVTIRGTKHQLSDRLYDLLTRINATEEMPGFRGKYIMKNHNGSYFKFPSREIYEDVEHDDEFYMNYISRVFIRKVKPLFDIDINLRAIYVTGFFDMLCEKYGRDTIVEMLNAYRAIKKYDFLLKEAADYGIRVANMPQLKEVLRDCI